MISGNVYTNDIDHLRPHDSTMNFNFDALYFVPCILQCRFIGSLTNDLITGNNL